MKKNVAERFIRILKNKIYKYVTSVSKYVSIDGIVNKYNNAYYRIIKMKSADGKPSMYINFNKENDMEGPKFKVGDNVGIPQYFCKRVYSKLVLISCC